jgi:exopolysaccharide biosynthesis polyprenyl glycosylphosphotransferase
MIRRHHAVFRLSLMSGDALSAIGTFVVLSIVRFDSDKWVGAWLQATRGPQGIAPDGVHPFLLMLVYAAAWVGVIAINDLYRLRARWSIRREALDVVRAGALLAVLTFSALFILHLPGVSRLFLLWLFPAQVIVTFVSRLALRWSFSRARERGLNTRFVLVVGTGQSAKSYADRIERHRELGLKVLGHLAFAPRSGQRASDAPDGEPLPPEALRRPILGTLDDIEDVLHSQVVDEVVICLPPAAWGYVEAVARICEDEGKIVRIPLVDGIFSLPGARQEEFDGIPMLSLVFGPDRILSLVAKRLLDLALSAAALVLLSPILIVVGLIVFMVDGRPIFFRQERVGLHGRTFNVVKFRTMVPDAEERLADLLEHNEIQGHAFKLSDDPRLSRTGRWLRRSSLDELPQLWNVFKGEMSLVGPRPPLPREVAGYDVWHRRRLSMKPGITGLWQVSARHEEEFDRWVEMDLDYIDRWSLWLDLKIMLRTIPAMLQGR